MTIYQDYYKRIQEHDNDLANPRQTFNWGYHDAASDILNKRERRTLESQPYQLPAYDPYYCAGYNARYAEDERGIAYTGDSSAAWENYIYTLPHCDYLMTVENIAESVTRGAEYLFTKKLPREKFTREQRADIAKNILRYAEPKNSRRRLDVYNKLCNRMLIKRHDNGTVTQEYLDALFSSLMEKG